MSSSKSTEPIRPAKSSTSRKSIVSSAMSDEEVITLKVEIDNTARAVASTRGEFKILGSVISAYTSQHPDSVELKDLWNMSDSVYYKTSQGCQYSATELAARAQSFLTKCGSFKSSTLPIETRQKIIASFLTTLTGSQDGLRKQLSNATIAVEAFEDPLKKFERKDRADLKKKVDAAQQRIKALQEDVKEIDTKTAERKLNLSNPRTCDIVTKMWTTLNWVDASDPALEEDLRELTSLRQDKKRQIEKKETALHKLESPRELALIKAQYQQLKLSHSNCVFRSIENFEAIQQGLGHEAREIQNWLALDQPTAKNAPAVLQGSPNRSVFLAVVEALRLYNVTVATG